jgi:hypothetical protein
MDPIYQDDLDEVWDANGTLISQTPRQRDITEEVVEMDLHTKVRNALAANEAMVADAQAFIDLPSPTQAQTLAAVQRLAQYSQTTAKELTALIRLLIREDLLRGNEGT